MIPDVEVPYVCRAVMIVIARRAVGIDRKLIGVPDSEVHGVDRAVTISIAR